MWYFSETDWERFTDDIGKEMESANADVKNITVSRENRNDIHDTVGFFFFYFCFFIVLMCLKRALIEKPLKII